MTRYFVTAWCDRPFYAQCEVEADSPEEALAKGREAIHDADAEECDDGYHWDEWRVDTEDTEGVLHRTDESARLAKSCPNLMDAMNGLLETSRSIVEDQRKNPDNPYDVNVAVYLVNRLDEGVCAVQDASGPKVPAGVTITFSPVIRGDDTSAFAALINALRAVLPYAESELASLQEAQKRDGGLEAEVGTCEATIKEASQLVSQIEEGRKA
jgi:hypothetical protein